MSLSSALTILKHEISPTSSEPPLKSGQPAKGIPDAVGGAHEIHNQSADANVLSNGNANSRNASGQQPRGESSSVGNNGNQSQQLHNNAVNNGNGVLDQPVQGSDGSLDKSNSKPDKPASEQSKYVVA